MSATALKSERCGDAFRAFALYIDQGAGGGPNAGINRVVPLPVTLGSNDEIPFRARGLTLYKTTSPGNDADDYGDRAVSGDRSRGLPPVQLTPCL
jgi:hypothetical protein